MLSESENQVSPFLPGLWWLVSIIAAVLVVLVIVFVVVFRCKRRKGTTIQIPSLLRS